MPNWLDAVLLGTEEELTTFLNGLAEDERLSLTRDLAGVIGLSDAALERGVLRVLIDRARAYALPGSLWHRATVDSRAFRAQIEAHLVFLGLKSTPERVMSMSDLHARFAEERQRIVIEPLLQRQDYRCALCGLRYHNEDLEPLGTITSPYGYRGADKADLLKPHWLSVAHRVPRADHVWPVSLYGSNRTENLQAICDACNRGKANYAFLAQSERWVGIPAQAELRDPASRVTPALFVAQLWRQPRCVDTGLSATDSELTVRVRDARYPLVIDNLETVASPNR